jgi:hypothetical protein
MNIRPAPDVPDKTEAERMDYAFRKVFTVSKEENQRCEVEWKKAKGEKAQSHEK